MTTISNPRGPGLDPSTGGGRYEAYAAAAKRVLHWLLVPVSAGAIFNQFSIRLSGILGPGLSFALPVVAALAVAAIKFLNEKNKSA
jgi:hypothetical protein